jgi:hypothetical protein
MGHALNRPIVIVAVLASLAAVDAGAQVHPIVGKWTWTRSVNNCTEEYEYWVDGSFDVVSGAEVASGKYEVSRTPDANGFFTLKGQTLKTNGGRDCSDSGVQPGDYDKPYTVYVIFHRAQPIHLVCQEPSLEQCFGPLRRVLR